MRILVINPNTTASMTEQIKAAAMAAASQGTEVLASIQNSVPPALKAILMRPSVCPASSPKYSKQKMLKRL
jgi:allantoin racemase